MTKFQYCKNKNLFGKCCIPFSRFFEKCKIHYEMQRWKLYSLHRITIERWHGKTRIWLLLEKGSMFAILKFDYSEFCSFWNTKVSYLWRSKTTDWASTKMVFINVLLLWYQLNNEPLLLDCPKYKVIWPVYFSHSLCTCVAS